MTASEPSLPTARLLPRRWLWLRALVSLAIIAAAAGGALYLGYNEWQTDGTVITIRFNDGHGLEVGDKLRHLGVDAGDVVAVRYDATLKSVLVDVALTDTAAPLAAANSRFWIVRPELSLEAIEGIDTVLDSRYLAVLPGDGPPSTEFEGLPRSPVEEELAPGGLKVIVEAETQGSLRRGAAVTYRGVAVGKLLEVGLSDDAASVVADVYIEPDFRHLIRSNSVFYETSGMELDWGLLRGVTFNMQSLQTLAMGGLGVITPNNPQSAAHEGQRFALQTPPEDALAQWRPSLPVGGSTDLVEPLPPAVDVRLSWTEGRIFTSDKQRSGWVLPAKRGVIGPASLLTPPNDARRGSDDIHIGGKWAGWKGVKTLGDAVVRFPEPHAFTPIPPDRVRPMSSREDVLVVPGDDRGPFAIAGERFWEDGNLYRFDANLVKLPSDLNGAAVVARASGMLVGQLVRDSRGWLIQPMQPQWFE